MIKTTKQLSAFRQTVGAIEHFHKKDYECAITLAGAAEGQVKEKTTNHLFVKSDLNSPQMRQMSS
jgi:hypothetical protein